MTATATESTECIPAPRRSLWRIEAELEQIEAVLDDLDATVEDKAAAVDAWLEGAGDLKAKVDSYCALIRLRESMARGRQEEANRLMELAGADSRVASQLKTRLHEFMHRHEIEKLETPRYKLARQKNGGLVPMHIEADPAQLPAEYTRTVIQADNERIRKALESGAVIEGCRLGERGEHLRIR